MQLHRRPLIGPERARLRGQPLRKREVAGVTQQRGAHEDVLLLFVETQVARERRGVEREGGGTPLPVRIARRQRLQERADRRVVRLADLGAQPAMMQHRAGLIAEREQHVVIDVLEPARTVRAHDHAAEAIVQVDRDGDERRDLPVGGCELADVVGRRVLPHDLIEREHLPCEALRDDARRRIVLEALRGHHVECAVPVVVLARQEHAPVRPDELDRRLEDQQRHVPATGPSTR